MRRLGFDPRASVRLRRTLRRTRPRIVLAHGAESAKYAAVAGLGDVPLVYYALGSADRRLLRRGPRRLLHRVYGRRSTVIAAVSRDVADEMRRDLGVPAGKLVVVPNGRDPMLFRPSDHPDPADRPARLVFVGHLTHTKRPELFVEVAETLRREGRRFEAVMVGDGPMEESLRPRAAAAGIDMLGRRDDVPEILSAGGVFVFPSLPEHEGMPGVLIEAGLCGLATVATDVPGVRDVVDDGETGLVVGVDDREGLVDAVRRLVADDALRHAMGRAARQWCLERFTLEASARRWAALLDEVVAGERRDGGRR
jgi:glycosyltransferase involved in cell wall biosynthesis